MSRSLHMHRYRSAHQTQLVLGYLDSLDDIVGRTVMYVGGSLTCTCEGLFVEGCDHRSKWRALYAVLRPGIQKAVRRLCEFEPDSLKVRKYGDSGYSAVTLEVHGRPVLHLTLIYNGDYQRWLAPKMTG